MTRKSKDIATQAIPNDSPAKGRIVPRRGSRKTALSGKPNADYGTSHLCLANNPLVL
jgi:hypothetical protein